MQFTYDEFCGTDILEIKDEVYNYLLKARRHKIDDEIYFRNLKDNNIEQITKDWLKENNVEYDKLIINAKEKLKFVKENNIEIFIDDSCRNCKDIAYNSNAKVFIMDTRVNQNLEDEKITRVYSWPHLYKEIKKLKEEN